MQYLASLLTADPQESPHSALVPRYQGKTLPEAALIPVHPTAEGRTRTTSWKNSSEAAKLSLETATWLDLKSLPAPAFKQLST